MRNQDIVADLRDVWKSYGKVFALQAISLQLRTGEIVGFIGPNGAGKTTLMKLMAGFTPATRGEVVICGEQINPRHLHTPASVGIMLDQISFIPHLSARKNLHLLASLRGKLTMRELDEWLVRVGLNPADERPVRSYSLGMRQRLGLAQALMEKPQLLLLDEPTNGLDPLGIIELRRLLKEVAQRGTSLLIASHLLSELELICDRVLLVQAGKMFKQITQRRDYLELCIEGAESEAQILSWTTECAVKILEQTQTSDGRIRFLLDTHQPVPALIFRLASQKVRIQSIRRAHVSLESEFLTSLALGDRQHTTTATDGV